MLFSIDYMLNYKVTSKIIGCLPRNNEKKENYTLVRTLLKLKLNHFLKNDVVKELLNDIKNQIREEEKYGELGDSGSLGHSLSAIQINRLDDRLSSKKALTVGQYLRKITSTKGIHSFSEKKFSEAQITKTYWSRLLNDKYKNHDKDKLIRIAISLKLTLKETMLLLNKAGFTLSEENKKDEVITFCLEERIYNLLDIDELLLEKELPTIFSNMRSIEK